MGLGDYALILLNLVSNLDSHTIILLRIWVFSSLSALRMFCLNVLWNKILNFYLKRYDRLLVVRWGDNNFVVGSER